MIHIRTWSVRKKVHYKAVKSKTKVGGEFQKMRDKFHCKLSKKLKKTFFKKNWNALGLQCVSFWCIASDSVIYSFPYSIPLWFITGYWTQLPVLYNRTLLFIHSIYNSLYLLVPNSQSNPPLPPLPLGNHKSVFYAFETASVSYISSFVPYFRFHIWVISYSICLSLSDLLHLAW